ncbi:MAG TPA: hypothetical protein PKH02_10800 [Bacteroidales bacterium]|nr:hypothetical protein [Bacteroidales bacterium]
MNRLKKVLLWTSAVVITVAAMFFQRITGPTYPAKAIVTINGNKYTLSLKRSQNNTQPCTINLALPENVFGELFYRKYPGNDEWTSIAMIRTGSVLTAMLPSQPEAGKLQYYISLYDNHGGAFTIGKAKPVIIRFKGDVPAGVLIPHILAMLIAMLLSTIAGLYAIFRVEGYRRYALITLISLLAGGFILGPLVQYYAFGQFWTGIPFGWDLTDNKTLIATLFWLVAVLVNRRRENRRWIIIAAVVLMIVFCIPHSLFGSQLDYSSNQVTQGITKIL